MCSKVSAIILAGGYSRRMGQDKAALRLGDKTLLELTVDKLRCLGIEEILVSGWESCPEGAVYVPDIYPHRGPLSGIHAGLLAASNPCALILPVDMPLLSLGTLQSLINAHGEKAITILEGCPLPGVFDAELSSLCEALLQADDYSLRRLLTAADTLRIRGMESSWELRNCNTPEDLSLIRKIFTSLTIQQTGGHT